MYRFAIPLSAASILATAHASPAATPITYGGGDGTSCEQAIIVQGAHGEADGVHSEYDWLKAHYPGYRMIRQAEELGKRKTYDRLDFADKDGKSHSVCFDISAFFGKF
jgi:hypothetical protein